MGKTASTDRKLAGIMRAAFARRGVASLDDLSHETQERLAGALGVEVTDLHRIASRHAVGRQPAVRYDSPSPNAHVDRDGVVHMPASRGHWSDEMLHHPTSEVWPYVEAIEGALRLSDEGSRSERYERVQKRLRKIGDEWERDEVSDRLYELSKEYRRKIRTAEREFNERQREGAEARGALARQAQAVLGAAKLVGIKD